LKARVGFEVNINWKKQQLDSAAIKRLTVAECIIHTNLPIKIMNLNIVSQKIGDGYQISFKNN